MGKLTFIKDTLNFRMPKAFGVDFNNDALKVLQLGKRKNHMELFGWNKKVFPKGTVVDGEIVDQGLFVETLIHAVGEAREKIKGKGLVVSIPENKVFTRIINIPLMNESEAAEAIKWETESNIPVSISDVFFDWQIVEKEEATMKVLVVACSKNVINNYLSVFQKTGFEVVAFEPESIATGRCSINYGDSDPTLVIDLGMDSTSFAIYQKGFPVFTSSGSVSGKILTDVISKHLGISNLKAENYKIKIGLGENKSENEKSMEILGSTLKSLLSETQKTISFFEDKLISTTSGDKEQDKKTNVISKVLICGGGSNLKGVASFLSVNLKKTVVQANPWENINFGGKLPPIPKEEAQSFVTSIGLALRAQNYEDFN